MAQAVWRQAGKRLAAFIEASTRQQITRAGLVFAMACALVGLAAFVSANNLLFLIVAAMLGTLLISGFISRLTLSGLELELDLPEHIAAGRTVTARLKVLNAKRWMASFSVKVTALEQGLERPVYFPVIAGGEFVEAPVDLLFPRRGSYRDSKFLFTTRFPFGFAERRTPVQLRNEVLVYPSVDAPPGLDNLLLSLFGELEAKIQGQGHDFYRIRPYEVLESARHVDWKATAHTGDLQVREFARDEDPSVEICLDLNVDAEEPEKYEWLEKAISCCAFLAWKLNEEETPFCLRTTNFSCSVPEQGSVHRVLEYLALVVATHGRELGASSETDAFRVVFTPSPERLTGWGWNLRDMRTRVVTLKD